MQWPPMSPDLNPMENVWALVKAKLRGRHFGSQAALEREVIAAWQGMDHKVLLSLVESMPRRMKLVIEAKGGYIGM